MAEGISASLKPATSHRGSSESHCVLCPRMSTMNGRCHCRMQGVCMHAPPNAYLGGSTLKACSEISQVSSSGCIAWWTGRILTGPGHATGRDRSAPRSGGGSAAAAARYR